MAAVRAVNDYGLDAELARKANAKYDVGLEREAAAWIRSVTGAGLAGGFGPALQDGVVLANLVNALRPGSIRVYTGQAPFKQMENISAFIKCARRMGVAESDLFTTVDLFELKNLGQVVTCVLALKRVAGGGSLGAASRAPRAFHPVNEGASVSKLNNGSRGFMDANKEEHVHQANRGQFARPGTNPNASVSLLNAGSYGVMQSTVDRMPVSESNRADFARAGPKGASPASRTVDRGPNSAYGVARQMPWDTARPASTAARPVNAAPRYSSKSLRRSWKATWSQRQQEHNFAAPERPPRQFESEPAPPKPFKPQQPQHEPLRQNDSPRREPAAGGDWRKSAPERRRSSRTPWGFVSRMFTMSRHRPGESPSGGSAPRGGPGGAANVRSLRKGFDQTARSNMYSQRAMPQDRYPNENNSSKERDYANHARFR